MGTLTINNTYCGPITYPEYGLLYNWYAATDAREITSSDDWIVPTNSQFQTLETYLGGNTVAGGKLKETGTTYWTTNIGATNEANFNLRGTGYRSGASSGTFTSIKDECKLRTSNSVAALTTYTLKCYDINATSTTSYIDHKRDGDPIRLLYTGAGTPTLYVGNDGKVYRIVLIGSQYWLADNLTETKFRNGDTIPWYGANQANYFTNAEWAALTTAGCCAYNNDTENVAIGFTFPS